MGRETEDHFEDFMNPEAAASTGGIFGSEALADLHEVRPKLTDDGVLYKLSCSDCGWLQPWYATFADLTVVAQNQPGRPVFVPKGWEFRPELGKLRPVLRCAGCGRVTNQKPSGCGVIIDFTPQEAERLVTDGVRSGHADPAVVQRVAQTVLQQLQGSR